jgi:hypothetical protein
MNLLSGVPFPPLWPPLPRGRRARSPGGRKARFAAPSDNLRVEIEARGGPGPGAVIWGPELVNSDAREPDTRGFDIMSERHARVRPSVLAQKPGRTPETI